MCADQRHQPEQLSLLCDTLESSGFEVVLQRYNLPNRLEVWVDGEQVFVLCDLRRISRGEIRIPPSTQILTFMNVAFVLCVFSERTEWEEEKSHELIC